MSDIADLQRLIAQGEGTTLEFKAAVPSPPHLARLVAGFANSGGGTILLGVRDDGSIPGVLRVTAENALRAALDLLTPKAEALFTELAGPDGHSVIRIDVAEEPAGPVATPDGVFRRTGPRLEPMPADAIRDRALHSGTSDLQITITPLAGMLETLTKRVLDLEVQVVAAQGWRRRLPDILLGAALSAFLGLVLALVFLKCQWEIKNVPSEMAT